MTKKSKSRRPQDQPQTELRIKARRERVVQLCAKGGKSTREASQILKREGFSRGASQTVVVRDLAAIAQGFADRLPEEREKAFKKLNGWMDELERDAAVRKPEKIAGCLQVYDRLSRLLGLDAPTKSISAKVDLDDPTKLVGYRRFVAETRELTEAQLEKVFEYARTLRTPRVLTIPTFEETQQ